MRRLALLVLLSGCGAPPPSMRDLSHDDDAHVHELPDLAKGDLPTVTGPARLSETGLYADFASRTLAPRVIRYTPRYELWSDGAAKERFLLLPPGTKIDTSDMDQWAFPVGTKAWKQFTRDGKIVETRLLMKVFDSKDLWWQMAYAWDAMGNDAVAAPDGIDDALGTPHRVPSTDECFRCHSSVRDVIIGVSAIQLSAPDGKSGDLSRLVAAGLLSHPPQGEYQPPGQGLVQDALGYLHGNCGHCHIPDSIYPNARSLQLRLAVADQTPEGTAVYRTGIGKMMFHVMPPDITIGIVPGNPMKSQLYMRAADVDLWRMPPVCTKVVDTAGLTTLSTWIAGLPQ